MSCLRSFSSCDFELYLLFYEWSWLANFSGITDFVLDFRVICRCWQLGAIDLIWHLLVKATVLFGYGYILRFYFLVAGGW
jgi:hypothetical protein